MSKGQAPRGGASEQVGHGGSMPADQGGGVSGLPGASGPDPAAARRAEPPVKLRLVDEADRPVLAIGERMPPPPLTIEMTNTTDRPVRFLMGPRGSPTLSLEFRHGVLSEESLAMLHGDHLERWLLGPEVRDRTWRVTLLEANDPGVAVRIGIGPWQYDIEPVAPGERRQLRLYGLSAAPEGGPRLTRVRLHHDHLALEDDEAAISGEAIQTLQILERAQPPASPLRAFFASGRQLDPEHDKSTAIIALEFRDRREIREARGARPQLRLSFHVGEEPWALCPRDALDGIEVGFVRTDEKASMIYRPEPDPEDAALAHVEMDLDSGGSVPNGPTVYFVIRNIPNVIRTTPKMRRAKLPEHLDRTATGRVAHFDQAVPIWLEYANIEGAPRGVIDLALERRPPNPEGYLDVLRRLHAVEKHLREGGEYTGPPRPEPAKPKKATKPVRHFFKIPDVPAWRFSQERADPEAPPLFATIPGVPGPFFDVYPPDKIGGQGWKSAGLHIDGVLLVNPPHSSSLMRTKPPPIEFGVNLGGGMPSNLGAQLHACGHAFDFDALTEPKLDSLKQQRKGGHFLNLTVDYVRGRLEFDDREFGNAIYMTGSWKNQGLLLFFDRFKMDLLDIQDSSELYPDAD